MQRKTIKILDIDIDIINKQTAIERFAHLVEQNSHALVTTPNTEFIIKAQSDPEFKNTLNDISVLNIPDSTGVLWAAWFSSLKFPQNPISILPIILIWFGSLILLPFCPKFYKKPITERVPGSEFIWPIAQLAAEKNYKIFLLGGAPEVAKKTASIMQAKVPNLQIAGTSDKNPNQSEEILAQINKSNADIVIVAFGAPKQEKWLKEYLPKTSCKVGIGLGGTFDFIAGTRKRAPKLFCKLGLEWLYRLIQEPTRLKRQLAIPKLMYLVLIEKIKVNLKKTNNTQRH